MVFRNEFLCEAREEGLRGRYGVVGSLAGKSGRPVVKLWRNIRSENRRQGSPSVTYSLWKISGKTA
jgi:hypothetical protein